MELEELEKFYKLNYKWGVFYKQCVLNTQKPYLKNLYKKLICQKKAFQDLLITQMLKRISKEDLQKIDEECKIELRKLQEKLHPEVNNRNSLLCCHVERKLLKSYCEALRKVTDGNLRALLLSQKHQLNKILKETEKVEKYLL